MVKITPKNVLSLKSLGSSRKEKQHFSALHFHSGLSLNGDEFKRERVKGGAVSSPLPSLVRGPRPGQEVLCLLTLTHRTHLEKRRVHVGHHVGQPPPLTDGQAAGHFHQALDEAELLLLRVADSQVSTVHVDLPSHLLRTTYFYLVVKEHYTGSYG